MDKALAKKLFDFQSEIKAIEKDLENPYFKSQYFDVNKVIEMIKPVLKKVGLSIIQPLVVLDGKQAIKTVIIDSETGSEYSETCFITELPKAQEMGSSITYFRRYALVSMLLLQGETDDDGNVASKDYAPRKVEPKKNYSPTEIPFN
jgi:hypothetical protein